MARPAISVESGCDLRKRSPATWEGDAGDLGKGVWEKGKP